MLGSDLRVAGLRPGGTSSRLSFDIPYRFNPRYSTSRYIVRLTLSINRSHGRRSTCRLFDSLHRPGHTSPSHRSSQHAHIHPPRIPLSQEENIRLSPNSPYSLQFGLTLSKTHNSCLIGLSLETSIRLSHLHLRDPKWRLHPLLISTSVML
jgi:hypothetical protein